MAMAWRSGFVVWCLAAAALAGVLTGCGGGGGGDDGGGAPPPGPGPVTFALTVNTSGSGTVTSSTGGINCGTVCTASFAANTAVVLTATPAAGQRLAAWGGACSGASGNSCNLTLTQATSVSASFEAAPVAGWSSAVTTVSSGPSGSAKVAMDVAGRAVAVWFTLEPGTLATDNLMAARFDPGLGWSTPVALESSPRDVMNVDLAMDPASGRAVVMWTQGSDTSASAAWARHFDPASGWTAAQPVQSAATPAAQVGGISVGIDAQGNAVAAWSQLDGSRFNVWGNRGTAAGVWGSAQLIETVDELGRVDGNPRIAVARQGDAVVVWQGSGGVVANRGSWTNRYTASAGWGTASQLVAVSGGSAPDIAMDANGNAVMVWGQVEVSTAGMFALIQAKRYQAGAWGSALQVGRELGANSVVSAPLIKMNPGGAALVAWGQGDQSIRATVAPAGGAWPAPTIVKAVASREATSALVAAIDDQGSAMLTWTQANDLGSSIDARLATRSAAGVWTAGAVHQAGIWGDPFIALNGRGDGLFLWTQLDNTSTGTQIRARRYSSGLN
jgi:Divergent InlB B-repeat domain